MLQNIAYLDEIDHVKERSEESSHPFDRSFEVYC
jgi:hypothetical protein